MKTFFYNIGYFLIEAKKTIRLNLLSNLFSVLGTGLILFLLGMVLTGWTVGSQLVTKLQEEAEISVYFKEGTGKDEAAKLVETIQSMEGVWDATLIEESEARSRMEKMLGEEASILELFDENPFEAFIEVRIHLESMDTVLAEVGNLEGINYVRDNRAVLEQIQGITEGLKILGYLIILAVSITTLIILSHMIRQGIYNNKEHINTLRLLGAPNSFIGFPYVLVGLLLTLLGGLLAIALMVFLINRGYSGLSGALPFLPLPPKEEIINAVSLLVLGVSVLLGLLGSLFGLSSIRSKEKKG